MPKFRNIVLILVNFGLYAYLLNRFLVTTDYLTDISPKLFNITRSIEEKILIETSSISSNQNAEVQQEISSKNKESSSTDVTILLENEGDLKIATVKFKNSIQTPTAIQIIVNYDPSKIQVSKVEMGDIWTQTNVLKNSVDNSVGELEIAAGQGFGATASGGTVAFTIAYTTKLGEVTFNVSPESKIVYSGNENVVKVDSSILLIEP